MSLPSVFSGVSVAHLLVLCVVLVDHCFLVDIVLSFRQFTTSNYTFGIFKLTNYLFFKTMFQFDRGGQLYCSMHSGVLHW
jgi:hypothetical protein